MRSRLGRLQGSRALRPSHGRSPRHVPRGFISIAVASCRPRVFPQSQRNLKVREKPPLATLPEVQKAISEAERALGEQGRVLVRYSGTEKKVRVLVEGPEQAAIDAIADTIGGALTAAIGA